MGDLSYNTDLHGFIVNEKGISWNDWLKYAKTCPNLVRLKPEQRPNPFKRGQMMTVVVNSFFYVVDGQRVGLLCWEEALAIGVAGRHPRLDAFVTEVCKAFSARFESIEAA